MLTLHSQFASRTDLSPAVTSQHYKDKAEQVRIAIQDGTTRLHQIFPYMRTDFEDRTLTGNGIVIATGRNGIQMCTHLIATLRNVIGTKLEIEVAYAGEEDLPIQFRNALSTIDPSVSFSDVANEFNERIVGVLGAGYAIKPFAILKSSFAEVIYIDADAIMLQDPAQLFLVDGYLETGTLYFHDRAIPATVDSTPASDWWMNEIMVARQPSLSHASSNFYHRLSEHEQESGVLVFDKRRSNVLWGLSFAAWMNTKEVREQIQYVKTLGMPSLMIAHMMV